jgi:Asp/Glu/hydantoin racemase
MSRKKILVINPNSSKSMTDSLDQLISNLNRQLPFPAEIHTYTAPSGPPSINNEGDALESAQVVFADLESEISKYDACLVACYSVHPLVGMLREKLAPHSHVTGIFEASISTALSLLPLQSRFKRSKFAIVSTGAYWENELSEGVRRFLDLPDLKSCRRFKGVETTGLNAIELHTAPPEDVRRKMMEATKRLVKDRDVKVICLGCAGMAGLDGIVEEALVEELGEEEAKYVHVLDGVKAGLGLLEGLLRALPGKSEDAL